MNIRKIVVTDSLHQVQMEQEVRDAGLVIVDTSKGIPEVMDDFLSSLTCDVIFCNNIKILNV